MSGGTYLDIHTVSAMSTTTNVKCTVTDELVNDLKNFDFYVEKGLGVIPIDSDYIKIYEYEHNKDYYKVEINDKFHDRMIKLYNITKDKNLGKIIKLVEHCQTNKKGWMDMVQSQCVKEMCDSINTDIMKNILINIKNYKEGSK